MKQGVQDNSRYRLELHDSWRDICPPRRWMARISATDGLWEYEFGTTIPDHREFESLVFDSGFRLGGLIRFFLQLKSFTSAVSARGNDYSPLRRRQPPFSVVTIDFIVGLPVLLRR